MGDLRGLLEELNKLAENPMVQKNIQQKQQGQNPGNHTTMQQAAQPASPPQQPPAQNQQPTNAETARQQAGQAPENQEPVEQDPAEIPTLEVFQAKILSEDGREELVEGLEALKTYLDDIGGGEATINDIQEHLQSDELAEQIQQIKEAGLA